MARRTRKAEEPHPLPPEAPLSRLLAHGPSVLSDAELLALILSADPDGSVLHASAMLVEEYGLSRLLRGGFGTLRTRMSEKEAARLMAAYEVAVRLAKEQVPTQVPLTSPREVVRYLYLRYGGMKQEVLGALLLDERNRLLLDREFFRGAACRVSAEPAPILRAAILAGATGIVVFHTHPSGDPAPSQGDKEFTQGMTYAAEAVGISLLDHLVIAGLDRWYSFHCGAYPFG